MEQKEDKRYQQLSLRGFNVVSSLLAVLNYNNVDDVNYVLAQYLLERIDALDTISIYDVAEDCYVSRSSIHRFVKNIGFDSFTHMKESIRPMRIHSAASIRYVRNEPFVRHIKTTTDQMLDEISAPSLLQSISDLARKIATSKSIVILSADTSSSSAKFFQQEMAPMGRLIKLVTNVSYNVGILNTLQPDDLLITCSVTGNFAITTEKDVAMAKAYKVLVTLNHATCFAHNYDQILYLSDKFESYETISDGMQNVYTRYGISYFFDLLFHHYIRQFYP